MVQHALETPHKCWFCPQSNLSFVWICENCKGVTRPTRDEDRMDIEWSVYSFGSLAPPSERTNAAFFPSLIEALDMGNATATAIRVGDSEEAVLLIRHPEIGKRCSVKKNDGSIVTFDWDDRNYRNLMLFYHTVGEILKADQNYTQIAAWIPV
ncbi:hypothetical protein MMC14_006223 [Varicellaria rhodocarpa]|nr:hypothetical protein [Varicellaria rhodocarpa]